MDTGGTVLYRSLRIQAVGFSSFTIFVLTQSMQLDFILNCCGLNELPSIRHLLYNIMQNV